MFNPEIAVIINSYNRLHLLKDCLKALTRWMPVTEFSTRCAIIVYDAGSTDGSLEWLKNHASRSGAPLSVIIPKLGDDTSFAAGINTGVAYAVKHYHSLKYLLFYETDNQILSPKPLIQALIKLDELPRLAACGFTVKSHKGNSVGVGQPFPRLINFTIGKNLVSKFQLERIPYEWKRDEEGVLFSEVDVVYTSPLLVKVEAWKESGGLDATTFPFSDCDVDWARRLWNIGWKMGVINTDDVIHDNQESISDWSKTRAIQSHRGRFRYLKRHHFIGIYLVWPFMLLIRHIIELLSTLILIKEPVRRTQLSKQFYLLLRTSLSGYEQDAKDE